MNYCCCCCYFFVVWGRGGAKGGARSTDLCGGQRMTRVSQFSPPTTYIPGIELKLLGLAAEVWQRASAFPL